MPTSGSPSGWSLRDEVAPATRDRRPEGRESTRRHVGSRPARVEIEAGARRPRRRAAEIAQARGRRRAALAELQERSPAGSSRSAGGRRGVERPRTAPTWAARTRSPPTSSCASQAATTAPERPRAAPAARTRSSPRPGAPTAARAYAHQASKAEQDRIAPPDLGEDGPAPGPAPSRSPARRG